MDQTGPLALEQQAMRILLVLPLLCLAAACQPKAVPASTGAPPAETFRMEDIAFAQAACGDCHAVEQGQISPNPESPTFAEIARRPGVAERTLATFLRDAHNYPEAMEFELTAQQADALAAYMMTLRGKR